MTGRFEADATGQGRIYQASGNQYIVEHHRDSLGAADEWRAPDSIRRPLAPRPRVCLRDRGELVGQLRDAFSMKERIVVLHGVGGSGKSALAYNLFERVSRDRSKVAMWVSAGDEVGLRGGMLAVAADRGATPAELEAARAGLRAAADLVWAYLDAPSEDWLLVIDGADDPFPVTDGGWLRASRHGLTVVTTRAATAHWPSGTQLLHVDALPTEDAASVLLDLAPYSGSPAQAAAVAARLSGLPLALTLVGSFLGSQLVEPWTLARCLDELNAPEPDGSTMVDGLGRSWELALDDLRRRGNPEAVTLLRLLACLSSEPLPLPMLADGSVGDALPASRINHALLGLRDSSLVSISGEAGAMVITGHQVVLDSVARGTPVEMREELLLGAATMLGAALPEQPERGPGDERPRLLAPHVRALVRRAQGWTSDDSRVVHSVADCALRLVLALHRSGDYLSALSLAEETARRLGALLGPDDPWVLRLRHRTGRALYRLRRWEEANSVHEAVLSRCESSVGAEGEDSLQAGLGLAMTRLHFGRVAEAAAMMSHAVECRSRALGSDHPLTLNARTYLVNLPRGPELQLAAQGADALVEDCRRALGTEHSITLAACFGRAWCAYATGRLPTALSTAREVSVMLDRRFGAGHPISLACRSLLSDLLFELGDVVEAASEARRVFDGRREALGDEHPWTVIAAQKAARGG